MTVLKSLRKIIALQALYFLLGGLLLQGVLYFSLPLSAMAICWIIFCTLMRMSAGDRSEFLVYALSGAAGMFISNGSLSALPPLGLTDLIFGMILLVFAAGFAAHPDEKSQCLRWLMALIFVLWIISDLSVFRIPSLMLLAVTLFVQSHCGEILRRRNRIRARSQSMI